MNYKDILIQLASMTVPYVYDNTVSFLELDRKLYKIVHELIIAMQGLNSDYEQFKTDMTNSFNEFTTTINNNFDEFKSDVNNQISTFEENMTTNFNNFKTEIENDFNTLQGEFNTLKTYVDNYFANLNLDEEVATVIQKMYDDGTLSNIINETIFTELNTKIDNLQEQVDNMDLITTITNELTYQIAGGRARYYNDALKNPSDNELFVVTFPDTDATYTNVELYYKEWATGSSAGWKITNITGVKDIKGQTLLVQARGTDTITFEVISLLPTKDLIQNKISDLLVTNCGTGTIQGAAKRYYVYSSAFGTPVDKQLFTIQMPNLPAGDNDVSFYNSEQSGVYSGWQLNNVKALDVSNELLLVQASVVEDVTTFNIVGILPSKEIIQNKISDLLVTNCGTGSMQGMAKRYYVYSSAFGTPVDKQLFTIQMPNLPAGDNDVSFYNSEQSGLYSGWQLNKVKAIDVSNELLLVQASVVEDVTTFNIVGILPNKPIYDGSGILYQDNDFTITTQIGTQYRKNIFCQYNTKSGWARFFGSFAIINNSSSGNGDVTFNLPTTIGEPDFTVGESIYVNVLRVSDKLKIDVQTIQFTWNNASQVFKGDPGVIEQNAIVSFIIPTQDIKIKDV